MANLKNDLDEYLLLQSDQKKTFKLDIKMPTIKVPEIKNLFGKSEPAEANSWLKDTQESCCPKLVRQKMQFLHGSIIIYIPIFSIVSLATYCWLHHMHWTRHFLYDRVHFLYSSVNIEGTQICTALFVGQFILHFEVR